MIGQSIARYEIKSLVGQGGMAAVYLAYDPRFRRNVAVKLISLRLQESARHRERFEREAQLIARIEHPAIVPVYDFGEQDDQLYLVMRYMPGGSLAGLVKAGSPTLRDVGRYFSQIAPALDAVHAEGIVHRDLKPANILLDNFGNPAISDFGIAYFTQATVDLTGDAVIGTPTYMSPEQVRGEDDLDARSDVYALGVILFELLTGRSPYLATTPLSVALKHISEPIPPLVQHRPDLPPELEAVIDRALSKNRDQRYDRPSDMADELQRVIAAQPALHSSTARSAVRPAISGQSTEIEQAEAAPTARDSRTYVEPRPVPAAPSPPTAVEKVVATAAARPLPPMPAAPTGQRSGGGLPKGLIFGGLALLVLIGCISAAAIGAFARMGFPGLAGAETDVPQATSTQQLVHASPEPESTATTAPLPTATLQPVPPTATAPALTILFFDDFSNSGSGWPSQDTERGWYDYRPDGYHIAVESLDTLLWARNDRIDDDISLHVDARALDPDAEGYYGLMCRIQDDGLNFYYFVMQNNGEVTIGKMVDGAFQSLLQEGWRQSTAFNPGGAANRLRADCSGVNLRLYVNDVLQAEAFDGQFASGNSGMAAAALGVGGLEVVFNDFMITALEP